MKGINYKLLLIEFAVILFTLFENFVLEKYLLSTYIYYLKPLVWLAISIGLYVWLNKDKTIIRKRDKFNYILVMVLLFNTLYYCSGLFLSFTRNAYNLNFLSIIRNIYSFVVILIPYEVIRKIYVNNSKSKLDKVFAFFAMFFIYFNIGQFIVDVIDGVKITYIFDTIIPCVVTQLFLNFVVSNCGLSCCLIWQLVHKVLVVILPIQPKFDWFYTMLFVVSSCLITFVFLYYTYVNKELIKDVKVGRKHKPYSSIFLMIFMFILVGFVTGMFGVKPTVVASNSMNSYLYKGDVVIINKNSSYGVNSVIQYRHDNISIIHRIVEKAKDENGKTYYKTKGDNNNNVDDWKVYDDQIEGVVCFVIPKIGYIIISIQNLLVR